MPSSDSEDFESADEGHSNVDKKERKKRLSSSNYSDKTVESDHGLKKNAAAHGQDTSNKHLEVTKETKDITQNEAAADGWDDFDIEDDTAEETIQQSDKTHQLNTQTKPKEHNSDTGWDDFDDWGQSETQSTVAKEHLPLQEKKASPQRSDIQEVTDRLAAASTGSGWGWGWGVDSLLSTATAGISTLTSQVSQGITTVLETGLGAPDPEDLAKKCSHLKETDSKQTENPPVVRDDTSDVRESGDAAFPFGSLISGVTKFVETTGSKVITGGLDTLETIGKKTMEVLQEGDPGLAKKRAMLGLDTSEKPVLSQVLREAKAKAEEEDRIKEEKREAKEVHYESLFDDFEGLVHLEALEMLSKQVTMRIEDTIRTADPEKRVDIKETLSQVAELCEMPDDEDDDDDDDTTGQGSKPDAFHERLLNTTRDIGVKIQFQPHYTEVLKHLEEESHTERAIYKRAVSDLAHSTALAVELYHKTAEMLLVKNRRSTADEADGLTQMTMVLTKHIGELATLFTEKLNSLPSENKEQVNTYITNIFLEAGNSSSYIQNAFQLALPILQIGAV